MRIVAVVGIRSQYVKIHSIQKMLDCMDDMKNLEMIYIDAGQHYDYELANGFIQELAISFNYRIIYKNKNPMHIFSEMIYKLYNVFLRYNSEKKIDYVMCFGDANTTMATAIAASKACINLIHVEAGLRLQNLDNPEEGNRIVADHLSQILFVSNRADFNNLIKEGIDSKAFFSGDVIQDLVLQVNKEGKLDGVPSICVNGFEKYANDDFIIASMHRKENIRDGCLESLFQSFNYINHDILFIAHPSIVEKIDLLEYDKSKVTITKYVPYYDMLTLIKRCQYLLTDSGAFQREAYYLDKRCIIRQDSAFWNYLVEIGAHITVGKTTSDICAGIDIIEELIQEPLPFTDYFGSGKAVSSIFHKLLGE